MNNPIRGKSSFFDGRIFSTFLIKMQAIFSKFGKYQPIFAIKSKKLCKKYKKMLIFVFSVLYWR